MVRHVVRQATVLTLYIVAAAAIIAVPTQAATQVSVPLSVTLPLQIIGADSCVSWTAGGTAAAPTLTCNTSTTTPPPAPPPAGSAPVCSITANGFASLTLTAAGSVTLAASCTNSPTSYTWTGVPSPVAGASQTVNVSTTTTFSVTATNASGTSSPASVTVTANIATPPASSFCGQYPNVQPTIVASWGQGGSWTTGALGGFPYNGVLVFQFTVPPGAPNSVTAGKLAVSEFQGLATMRQVTISTQACDFRSPDYKGVNGPLTWSNGTTATVSFGVVSPDQVGATGALAGLVAGQTYFVNVRNWSIDLNGISCPTGSVCNAIINAQPASP